MNVQIINTRFSNEMVSKEITFEDIEKIISNPYSFEKEKCILWKFISSDSNIRNSEFYTAMYALEVDIDNKDPKKITTISEFEERFKEYTYFLYTTSSYIKNEIDKFRVIIPLEQRIKWNVFYNSKEELGVYFNTADNSSWTNFHNLPNIVPGKTDYYYKINYGKFWNFVSELLPIRSEILMKRQQEKPQIVVEYTNMPNEDYKKQQLEKILKKLNDIPSDTCGDRYTRLVSVTCRMILVKHNGEYIFSDHEIEQTILSHTDDARVRAMLKSNLKQDRDTLKHKVGK